MKFWDWLTNVFSKRASAPIQASIKPSYSVLCDQLLKYYVSKATVREGVINNTGKEVEEFQKTVDGKAQRESWCMAFMQTGLLQLCNWCVITFDEVKHLTGRELYNLTPIPKAELCYTVFAKCPDKYKGEFPGRGAWMIQKDRDENSIHGHTGCVLGPQAGVGFRTIEGNVSVDGGQGVDYKVRTIAGTPDRKVIGFIDVAQAVLDTIEENKK